MKKMIIAAGTGFLGNVLIEHFKKSCEQIVILTRGKSKVDGHIRYVNWDARKMTGWETELENADVLINLAGKSVDCRYTDANKKEIFDSRIDSTSVLNLAVRTCANPPQHWLNSSTATIYSHSLDKQMDETYGEIGTDFSMDVAKAWEAEFFSVETPKTLKTAMRTSIVLGKKGGALPPLKKLARFGFGGKQGSGRQFISWIHEKDFARAVEFCITQKLGGCVNVVAPEPIRNALFMRTLRTVLGVAAGVPVGKKMLEFGANIMGTETELILKSRNVVPKRLNDSGFRFVYGTLEKALHNLIR
ncbi:TIGR01777 family oxidoreductase [Flavobacterium selenitireducens]|uniref:TIGR01777 family oxidoreductase n=1 Tax=Flavobacterium selenitireducens TaxID=2722704 RepID=UPI00168B90FB|nr:TIGR01777 family oxidoreductase [Flavobacterium selenitireducens]MBD3583694.1 TIGR01777 family protein [Flavobacterium selenitireducens]